MEFRDLPMPVEFRYLPDGTFLEELVVQEEPYSRQVYLREFPAPGKEIEVFVDGARYLRADTYPPLPGFFFFDRVTCSIFLPSVSAEKVKVVYKGIGTIVRASLFRDGVELAKKASQAALELYEKAKEVLAKLSGFSARIASLEKKYDEISSALDFLERRLATVEQRYERLNEPVEGLFSWQRTTKIVSALRDVNEYLLAVAKALGEVLPKPPVLEGISWVSGASLRSKAKGKSVVVAAPEGARLFVSVLGDPEKLNLLVDDVPVQAQAFARGFSDDRLPRNVFLVELPPLSPGLHALKVQDEAHHFLVEEPTIPAFSVSATLSSEKTTFVSGTEYTTKGSVVLELLLGERESYRVPNVQVIFEGKSFFFVAEPGVSERFEVPLFEGISKKVLELEVLVYDTTFDFSGMHAREKLVLFGPVATLADLPTDTFEPFTTETYRILPEMADDPVENGYPSKLSIPTEAEVRPGGLVFREGGADWQSYARFFRIGGPYSNGKLVLRGKFELGGNLKAYLKVPRKTGWLDLTQFYDSAAFDGADGQGCLLDIESSAEGVTLHWTLGSFYADVIVVRLVLASGAELARMWVER